MFFLRAWMWIAPVAMLVVSGVFAVLSALDGNWGLMAVMVVIGVVAVGMLVLHWWLLYRFGRQTE